MPLQDFTGHTASLPMDGSRKHFLLKSTIDCYNSVANGGFGTWADADTARLLEVKEGWEIRNVWIRVVRLGTVASVLDKIGDSVTGDTCYMAGDCKIGSTGTVGMVYRGLVTDTNQALGGYLMLVDGYLLGTNKTALFDGIFEIVAEVVNVFGGETIIAGT
ncbi:MAG: hypothetical protein IMZ43_09790 [Thermoplasmata archaeon]|nr:hypothetical protein [Thermoplasmata archaeon]